MMMTNLTPKWRHDWPRNQSEIQKKEKYDKEKREQNSKISNLKKEQSNKDWSDSTSYNREKKEGKFQTEQRQWVVAFLS